jgi:hypothetical protein
MTTAGKPLAFNGEDELVQMNGGAVTVLCDAFPNRVAKSDQFTVANLE